MEEADRIVSMQRIPLRRGYGLLEALLRDRFGLTGLIVLAVFGLLALFGTFIAPFGVDDITVDPDGTIPRLQPPSKWHFLGTTNLGQDVFSQVVHSTKPALAIGLLSSFLSTAIGALVGLVAGYFGGGVDTLLMRLTDVAYGIPFVAFAMVLITFLGPSVGNLIGAIALITWRTTARVIRAQVLVIREKPFIQWAHLAGISRWRILGWHILPNVLPLCYAYVALTASWAILTEASISFLGYGDPATMTWGKMLHLAYITQSMQDAWWWVFPPGLAIALLSLACLFVGRALEQIVHPWLRGGFH